MAPVEPVRRLSRTQTIYEQLRSDLIGCRLLPNEHLNISELAKERAASPGAIREALSRLTAENLVVAESHRGFRVSPISMDDLEDLTAVRIDIEEQCLRRSIANASVEWESELVAAYHRLSRMPQRGDEEQGRVCDQWAEAHRHYHESLVGACDSKWLLRMREHLYIQSERYRRLSVPLAETGRDVGVEHQQILDAALSRNAERSVQLLVKHMSLTTQIIQQTR